MILLPSPARVNAEAPLIFRRNDEGTEAAMEAVSKILGGEREV